MPTLVITRGLPASGKSTWARAWVAEDEANRARVNRDDIRHMVCGRYWPAPEDTVTVAEKAMVESLLRSGRSVVVDATHLRMAHARDMAKLAHAVGAEFDYVDFPTSPEECAVRDKLREVRGERAVGADVIYEMARKFGITATKFLPPINIEGVYEPPYTYKPDTSLPVAWLVDIDGTLAHMNGRGPFEWHRVGEDDIDERVRDVVHSLAAHFMIVLLSGRDESCRAQTEEWLVRNGIFYHGLFMRPAKDMRKDSIVKLELFQEHVAPYYNVHGVLDDRDQVVKMWRHIGLKCLQVAEGNF